MLEFVTRFFTRSSSGSKDVAKSGYSCLDSGQGDYPLN